MIRRIYGIIIFICIAVSVYASSGQAQFEQGMGAFRSGNYKNAELLFRKVVDLDDEYADEAWFYLARSLFYQKRYQDAIFEFNKFLLSCRNQSYCTEGRYWIAESYFQKGDYLKSIEEYKRYITITQIENDPLVSQSHERIGDIYAKQNRYDEAIIEWRTGIKTASPEKRAYLSIKIAGGLLENGDVDDAEKMVMPLLSDQNADISNQAFLLVGRINQIKDRHRVALRFFVRIPESSRTGSVLADTWYWMAVSYHALNEDQSTLDALTAFKNANSESVWKYHAYYLEAVISQGKNPDESARMLEEIILKTDNPELKVNSAVEYARIATERSRFADAVRVLEGIRNSTPEEYSKKVLFTLGEAYLSANRLDDAGALYQKMLNDFPYDEELDRMQFFAAVTLLKKGEAKKASDSFESLREMNPFSKYLVESQLYAAQAQYELGNYAAAVKQCEAYLARNSIERRYDALMLELNSFMKQDNSTNAEKIAISITRRFPDKAGVERDLFPFIIFALGKGKDSVTVESFVYRSFPLSDTAVEIGIAKGDRAYGRGDYKSAEQFYVSSLKLRSNEALPDIFVKRIQSIYNQGRYQDIISILSSEPMSEYRSDVSMQIVLHLARSLYKTGAYERALVYFALIRDSITDPEDVFAYFDCAVKNDQIALSRDIALKLKVNRDFSSKILFSYGEYYRDIFNYEMARGYFSQVYADNPGTDISERAVIELAFLDYKEGRYEDLLNRIKIVPNKSNENRKIALILSANIKLGKMIEVAGIVKTNRSAIVQDSIFKEPLKDAFNLFANNNDITGLTDIGKILVQRDPTESDLVNYYIGNYYYKEKVPMKSLDYFSRIRLQSVEYRSEVAYKLGMIYELSMRNVKTAMYYYQLLQDSNVYDEYVAASKVELAVIYAEKAMNDQSRKLLVEVMSHKESVASNIRAKNLFNYYGYDKNPE